jgi:hypothetical protein
MTRSGAKHDWNVLFRKRSYDVPRAGALVLSYEFHHTFTAHGHTAATYFLSHLTLIISKKQQKSFTFKEDG